MQNILVPTDFSNNAYHALYYTTELLKNRECKFFLLNVYGIKKGFENKRTENGRTESSNKLKAVSEAKLKSTLDRIKKSQDNPKHTYILISRPNDLIQALHSLVDELQIHLMVLGAKGQKSSIPLFLGSTTTETLESVKKCPILVVPKGAKIEIPRALAFATDYKKPFSTEIIDYLRFIAHVCKATIRIVHIDEEERLNDFQQSNLDSLLAQLKPVECSVERMPNFISKSKVIQFFLEDSGIDMLAMVNHEHGVLEKMLREPVIEKMVLKTDVPFIIVPERR